MKATLRKQLRAKRRALPEPDHRQRSLAAAKGVARLPSFRAGRRVALYLPFDGELDTAGAWGWGAGTMIEPLSSAGDGATGRARAGWGSPLTASAPMRRSLTLGTYDLDSLATESGMEHFL